MKACNAEADEKGLGGEGKDPGTQSVYEGVSFGKILEGGAKWSIPAIQDESGNKDTGAQSLR
jgi:hypothetical protein